MTIFAFEVPANRDYQINQHGWTQWLDYLKVMKIQLQQNAPPQQQDFQINWYGYIFYCTGIFCS